jgi:GH15 family glucan-1,4-alpha-glucosidase
VSRPPADATRRGSPPPREDGYAPLASYIGIGDGRSIALVALDGSIDWWAVPDLHSVPAFSGLLDTGRGGSIGLAPVDPYTVERRYLDRTNVAETIFTTDTGQVRITDSLNSGAAGRLPWAELARRIEGLAGSVTMQWHVTPGSALATLSPEATESDDRPVLRLGDTRLAIRYAGIGDPTVKPTEVSGRFTCAKGSRGVLGVVATKAEPLYLPSPEEIDQRIDNTVDSWRRWSDSLQWNGDWEDDIRRSALALKLLIYAPTGAIAAAATTSLPERIGGDKNWDYRYTWTRDTAYTLDALIRCKLREEVHAATTWLLSTVERHLPGLDPFYTLDGELPDGATTRKVPGYRGSTPVRDGNDAARQLQLGPYGDLLQTVYLCVTEGHLLDDGTARMLADLADRCCDQWQEPDAGMWELPGEEHYTASKMSCWQALDRAVRLSDLGQLRGRTDRWRAEADRIRDWVNRFCWSDKRQTYTMYAGSDALDAGVLLGARFGFDRGRRMTGTLTAVRDELGRGPLLYRYSGMDKEEGAFLACSYWAVEALAFTGRRRQARHLMEQTLKVTRHAFLLSEMVDPQTGDLLGNLPQALSHLALINAASAIEETNEKP